jgi:hypothetical protein
MMITARRNERRLRAEPLHQFEAQHVAVKFQRAVEIGHFQMDVPDPDPWIHRRGFPNHDLL